MQITGPIWYDKYITLLVWQKLHDRFGMTNYLNHLVLQNIIPYWYDKIKNPLVWQNTISPFWCDNYNTHCYDKLHDRFDMTNYSTLLVCQTVVFCWYHEFAVPQMEYPDGGISTKGSHAYVLLIAAMVLILWCQIDLLWHQITMVASDDICINQ